MFIVSLTYKSAIEKIDDLLPDHVAYLEEQYIENKFIASGRKVPRTGGIILSNVKTRDELETILAKDPFHSAGIAEYDIIEFIPSMTADGYENLKNR